MYILKYAQWLKKKKLFRKKKNTRSNVLINA